MSINLTGYDILVRDAESKENLLASKIVSYNPTANRVELDAKKDADLEGRLLNVLIYNNQDAYEYSGNVNKFTGTDNIEIGLFHGVEKSERKNERYNLGIPAVFIEYIDSQIKEKEHQRIPIKILDISRSGIRIESPKKDLEIGAFFAIVVIVTGVVQIYRGKVVRIAREEGTLKEYGCMLLTKEEYPGQI